MACNKLDMIWNSNIHNSIKVSLFQAIIMLRNMDINIKTTKETRRNIYKPTTTSTEHTLDTTHIIKRHIQKTAKNMTKAYPKKGSVCRTLL